MNEKRYRHTDHLRHPAWQALHWGLLVLVFLVVGMGCTDIKNEESVSPNDPFKIPIGNLTLATDSLGAAILPLSSLHLNHSKPFSFTSRDFKHGDFGLSGDSALVYLASDTGNWKADSGFVTVSQSGVPKDGFLKIVNTAYVAPVVPGWNVVYLKGTPVPDMNPIFLDYGDPRSLTNLKGMEEQGSEIDSVWGMVYSANESTDKQKINYLASGGIGNFLTFGTDHIYYRIKRPNGLYFRGMVPVFVGDTSLPGAENDVAPIQPSGTFIPWSQLMENDKGSSVVLPRTPFSMRLRPIVYQGTVIDSARFGIIKDSVSNGVNGFFYKRMIGGTENDTAYIFLQEGPDSRITRSRLILSQ